MNTLINAVFKLMTKGSIKELQVGVCTLLGSVFFAEKIRLWMADADTGIFHTMDNKT